MRTFVLKDNAFQKSICRENFNKKAKMMKALFACFILMVAGTTLWDQPLPGKPDKSINYVQFFKGCWHGEGHFANGRAISANASFKLSLDSSWLLYTHTDQLPNRYKAISMWSIDKAREGFTADIFDNFHGHRLFAGVQSPDDIVTLVHSDTLPNKSIRLQRFTYKVIDPNHFKMAYETSGDGRAWKMGDSLVFAKKSN